LAAAPQNVTFPTRLPFKEVTTGSRKAGRTAHVLFRLKSSASGDRLIDKQGNLTEIGIGGRPNPEIRSILLTVIGLPRIGVEL
jgi:hypothetical protein